MATSKQRLLQEKELELGRMCKDSKLKFPERNEAAGGELRFHPAGTGGGRGVTPPLTFHLRGEHLKGDVAVETVKRNTAHLSHPHELGRLEAKTDSKTSFITPFGYLWAVCRECVCAGSVCVPAGLFRCREFISQEMKRLNAHHPPTERPFGT